MITAEHVLSSRPGSHMRTIASRSNPLIRQFRDVADGADPESPLVLLDGVHLVTTALDARLPMPVATIADAELDDPEFVALIARLEAAGMIGV